MPKTITTDLYDIKCGASEVLGEQYQPKNINQKIVIYSEINEYYNN